MPTGYELQIYRSIVRLADATERIAQSLDRIAREIAGDVMPELKTGDEADG